MSGHTYIGLYHFYHVRKLYVYFHKLVPLGLDIMMRIPKYEITHLSLYPITTLQHYTGLLFTPLHYAVLLNSLLCVKYADIQDSKTKYTNDNNKQLTHS